VLRDAQLAALGSICDLLDRQGIEYWLFGGWAVDFYAGRPSRDHDDLDLAVWVVDHSRISGLLTSEGWAHAPEPGEDGYTGYERAGVRLELAFLDRDEHGETYTPLQDGRGA
jgi:Aminoglycoside-2''-adenylyltransferase